MTEDEKRLERKIDELLELAPTIRALGEVLVERTTVNERLGLNRNTITKNEKLEKFAPVGQRKTLLQIRDIAVIRTKKHRK